jgi:hypothetical protein
MERTPVKMRFSISLCHRAPHFKRPERVLRRIGGDRGFLAIAVGQPLAGSGIICMRHPGRNGLDPMPVCANLFD